MMMRMMCTEQSLNREHLYVCRVNVALEPEAHGLGVETGNSSTQLARLGPKRTWGPPGSYSMSQHAGNSTIEKSQK